MYKPYWIVGEICLEDGTCISQERKVVISEEDGTGWWDLGEILDDAGILTEKMRIHDWWNQKKYLFWNVAPHSVTRTI